MSRPVHYLNKMSLKLSIRSCSDKNESDLILSSFQTAAVCFYVVRDYVNAIFDALLSSNSHLFRNHER